jgi:hypothetical protein
VFDCRSVRSSSSLICVVASASEDGGAVTDSTRERRRQRSSGQNVSYVGRELGDEVEMVEQPW